MKTSSIAINIQIDYIMKQTNIVHLPQIRVLKKSQGKFKWQLLLVLLGYSYIINIPLQWRKWWVM